MEEHLFVVLAVLHSVHLLRIVIHERQGGQLTDVTVVAGILQRLFKRELPDAVAELLGVNGEAAGPAQIPIGTSPFLLVVDHLALAHAGCHCPDYLFVGKATRSRIIPQMYTTVDRNLLGNKITRTVYLDTESVVFIHVTCHRLS